jgi:ornithine carbamoyltransferase
MADEAGIAVYDGLACDDDLISRLASQIGNGAAAGDNRRFVLQAMLLRTIA